MNIFDYIVRSNPEEVVKCPVCGEQPEIGPCIMDGNKIIEWEIFCDQPDHFISICRNTKTEVTKDWNEAFRKVEPCVG